MGVKDLKFLVGFHMVVNSNLELWSEKLNSLYNSPRNIFFFLLKKKKLTLHCVWVIFLINVTSKLPYPLVTVFP